MPAGGHVGRVVARVAKLGYVGAFLRTPFVIALLFLPALWLVLRRLLRTRRRSADGTSSSTTTRSRMTSDCSL